MRRVPSEMPRQSAVCASVTMLFYLLHGKLNAVGGREIHSRWTACLLSPYSPPCYNVAFVPADLTIFPPVFAFSSLSYLLRVLINIQHQRSPESLAPFPNTLPQIIPHLTYNTNFELVAGTPYRTLQEHSSDLFALAPCCHPAKLRPATSPHPHATLPLQDPVVLAG